MKTTVFDPLYKHIRRWLYGDMMGKDSLPTKAILVPNGQAHRVDLMETPCKGARI